VRTRPAAGAWFVAAAVNHAVCKGRHPSVAGLGTGAHQMRSGGLFLLALPGAGGEFLMASGARHRDGKWCFPWRALTLVQRLREQGVQVAVVVPGTITRTQLDRTIVCSSIRHLIAFRLAASGISLTVDNNAGSSVVGVLDWHWRPAGMGVRLVCTRTGRIGRQRR
jgi:hypothetical protein